MGNIEEVEIGTADSDQSTATKLKKVAFPSKYDGLLEADSHQKLVMKFQLRDSTSEELITVHQAFIRLTHQESQQEIFFVAEPDVNDVFKFDLDLAAKAKDFLYLSGLYSVNIIIGDAVIENPRVWNIADLELKFGAPSAGKSKPAQLDQMYLPKPEIEHMFRQPETPTSIGFQYLHYFGHFTTSCIHWTGHETGSWSVQHLALFERYCIPH